MLAICCTSLLVVSMDNTILTVALPSLKREFEASVSALQWTMDAYLLTLASLLLLSGSVADRVGRKPIFGVGLAIFTFGSVLCSLAPGIGWLIAARVLQAVGGSMLNPVAMSIIRSVFTDPAERAKAIGLWGSVFGISLAIGPVVGGVLTEHLGWRSIFWVNVPIGLVAMALTWRFVPNSRAAAPRRLDPVGQVLVLLSLVGLISALSEGPGRGWDSPDVIAGFVLAAVALPVLIAVESRLPEPLIELRLFRRAPVTTTAVSGMPADRSGVAAATATTSRQVGQAIGVAVGGSLVASAALGPELVDATQPVWWLCVGIGLAILTVGVRTAARGAP